MSRTTLSMAAVAILATASGVFAFRADGPQRFKQAPERHTSSISAFGATGYAGSIIISHGQPVWKDGYSEQVKNRDAIAPGSRFRFGNNLWATFESTSDTTIGGVDVPAGYYYLAFEKGEDSVGICMFDAAEMRKKKVPSFQPLQSGGISIPMALEETDDDEEDLYSDFGMNNKTGEISLEIYWGPFELTAPVTVADM